MSEQRRGAPDKQPEDHPGGAAMVAQYGQPGTAAEGAPGAGRPEPNRVPEKPSLDGLAEKWSAVWEEDGTFRFERPASRAEVYAIDTPPPTVSGSLHMGSVFGYVQTDAVARYHRMRGAAVFYPMGWDDNGLPTERRVENFFGVRCDPSLPYDPTFAPPAKPDPKRKVSCSRPNFVALCEQLTGEDEKIFELVWRRVGLSVDWSMTYTTIGDRARRVSQTCFLRNLERGEAYAAVAPTLWDVTYQTAVAQAELEERDQDGAYHRYGFAAPDGTKVMIETTRPELLPACVALVAHPEDARYRALFGTTVRSPLFDVEVPVVSHPLAEPDKGSGIAMVCTFGDTTDVTWWRELDLPVRSIVERDGRLRAEVPDWITTERGRAAYAELAGRGVKQAQARIVDLLREAGELDGEPKPIRHPVKFYENGDRPLEIVTGRQWYIRNGGRDAELQELFLRRGAALAWHPPWLRQRYDSWVEGLANDWLISRQRFFGVPFPLWYPLDAEGIPDYEHPLVPDAARLPIDPSSDVPEGYTAEQRGEPEGFIGDPDIMDTWATSSLTPQIVTGWGADEDLFRLTFPLDLRPQGHDIIRTWLFDTVIRAELEHHTLPWGHAMLNGWVLDPDRKKMSKSKGNVVTPLDLIAEHGPDAIRYWACSGRPGTDTALDPNQFRVGRRLAIKLLNASKFTLGIGAPAPNAVPTEAIDRSLLALLDELIEAATDAFEGYDYARSLERTEAFFWMFCDDYLELVKARAYGSGARADSARATLRIALSVLQRLFAPVLPFVAEEVWSWWQEGSVHRSAWPTPVGGGADPALLGVASEVLAAIRRSKTEAKQSMKAPVATLRIRADATALKHVRAVEADLREAGNVAVVDLADGSSTLDVTVELSA